MNQPRSKKPVRLLFVLCAASFGAALQAEEPRDEFSRQAWVNPGTFSYHFDRHKDLREANTGLGAEWVLAEDHVVAAGSFINSNRERSRYGAYYWRPMHWQPAGIKVHAGIAAGVFDGYPNYRNGAWFPAALPMLAVEGERVGANIFFVPTIKNRLDGAIAVQFKLRVW
jgi:hypothetical protein